MRHLNVALNNITRIENVQRCESLERLDLTANFIAKSALTSVACLRHSIHFRELHLLGNPCAEWDGYRDYVIAALPQLQKLVRLCSSLGRTSCFCLACSSMHARR